MYQFLVETLALRLYTRDLEHVCFELMDAAVGKNGAAGDHHLQGNPIPASKRVVGGYVGIVH